MHIKLPFKRDLYITKRGLSMVQDGQIRSFVDWVSGVVATPNTPILEEIYSTIASEFAKIDLQHIIEKNDVYKHVTDELNYLIAERPNPLQTKFDFLYTMAYQLYKYGNALAFLQRDKNGKVIRIDPVDVLNFEFGNGYQIDETTIYFKYKNKKTGQILLVDYQNCIHLRLNPNNIFNGDLFGGIDDNRAIVDLIDCSLKSLINELKQSGTVRGVIQIGSSQIGYAAGFANRAMADQETKIAKQDEIINRIKATRGGILVLDAGEEWKDLKSPFDTVSSKEIDKYIDMLLQFNGINKAVVDGTATAEQMEVFYNQRIVPRIEQFVSELNYKVFTKTAKSQGHKIEYRRDVFEYIPVTKAIDVIYKGVQDTTTNERRRMIYKLPPIPDGDVLMINKNFEPIDDFLNGGESNGETN